MKPYLQTMPDSKELEGSSGSLLRTKASGASRNALWVPESWQARHLDDGFFENIVINAEVTRRSYWSVVWAACAVTQQIAITAIVASTAYQLYLQKLSVEDVLIYELAIGFLGIFMRSIIAKPHRWGHLVTAILKTLLLHLLAAALTPVYASLSASIANDTILFSSISLLCFHLYSFRGFHDTVHRYNGGHAFSNVGLAAAMTSSALVASQMRSLDYVFCLVCTRHSNLAWISVCVFFFYLQSFRMR